MPANDRRRTTIKDVAQRAGVSVPTVSRVLGGTYPVASATRARVQRAMRDLDYVVNAHARALAGASTRTVAFLLDDVTGPFFAHIAQGVEQQATAEGRLCLVCTTQGDQERELAVIEVMREQHAEAVILVGGGREDAEYRQRMARVADALDKAGSRLVLCGRPSLGEGVPATVVEYDNEGGAYALTSYLLSAGHRRIAFLGRRPGFTTTSERIAGFRRAHQEFGVELDPDLVLTGAFTRTYGYEAARRLLANRAAVTAIFAATDMVASGVLQALREAAVRVPDDVSVVGYDDVPLAVDVIPSLTTVHVPHEELGRTAVRLALHRDREQHVVLGTHIVVRDSVAAVPPSSRRR